MRCLTPFALVAMTLATSLTTASDDLFSEVAVESVFASTTPKTTAAAETASAAGSARVTGAGQLGDLLRSLGYETQRLDGKAVKVTVSHGVWTIPTTLRAAVDRGQIDITMGLATPEKDSDWNAAKLLKLLVADIGPAYFAFDRSIGQIQLRQTVTARNVTADRLSRLIKEMAELAASRESSWYEEPKKESQPAATASASLPTGTWLAKPAGAEAFALNLTSGGQFSLVHVKAGRTVRSNGKATRSGSQLTLAGGDGTRVVGSLSGESAQGFTLTLGSRRLTFAKAG